MGRVEGKVALVTGAAQGLGRAIAELLGREGAHVVVTDIQDELGASVADGIANASFLPHDVAVEEDWERVIGDVLSARGALHILVNNAGIALQKNVVDTTLEEWRRLQAINLDGVFLGVKHGIPAIAASGGGSIVNLSSMEGIIAHPEMAAYNASKGGVRLLTKSAALYCGKQRTGVRVNSVHPAFATGPLLEEYLDAQPDREKALAELKDAHPIGYLGEPQDVAYGVLYLASDESKWVTGTELVLDGGWTAA
jgi:NAD(P)-dependent dehydrogenase (short-subunit alcohol dehydrogenase family)